MIVNDLSGRSTKRLHHKVVVVRILCPMSSSLLLIEVHTGVLFVPLTGILIPEVEVVHLCTLKKLWNHRKLIVLE